MSRNEYNCADCKINEYLEQLRKEGIDSYCYPSSFDAPCGNLVNVELNQATLLSVGGNGRKLKNLIFYVQVMRHHGCPISLGGLWGGKKEAESILDIAKKVRDRKWGVHLGD